MKGLTGALIVLAVLCSVGSWMLGYREGEQTGVFRLVHDMDASYDKNLKDAIKEDRSSYDRDSANLMDKDRDAVCNEIRRYKLSIAKDLDENTQICGWRDMDGPEFKLSVGGPPLTRSPYRGEPQLEVSHVSTR